MWFFVQMWYNFVVNLLPNSSLLVCAFVWYFDAFSCENWDQIQCGFACKFYRIWCKFCDQIQVLLGMDLTSNLMLFYVIFFVKFTIFCGLFCYQIQAKSSLYMCVFLISFCVNLVAKSKCFWVWIWLSFWFIFVWKFGSDPCYL